MSLPVLIGFAGVVVAAVATGMLAGRCVRRPTIALIAWTAATLALTAARPLARYFLFLRWTRVLRSSLRCFFLAMRLRRFLITEPTDPPLLCVLAYGHAHAHARRAAAGHTPTPQVTSVPAGLITRPPFRALGGPPNASQLAATKASRRYWLTACSGTRNERPTRIASSSPE